MVLRLSGHNIEIVNWTFRPRSEPSLERMKVGMAPMTLTHPVDQAAHEPYHRSHADIVLSPTPPPKAPQVQLPWQPARARATVAMSPQPVHAAPAPPPARSAISPVPVAARPLPKPAEPKQSDLLAYIRDEEK